jgi:hypothetical protein
VTLNSRLQLLCVWAGPACLVGYGIFFWGVAGYIPPLDPTAGADEVAAFYDENRTDIRIGQLGGLIASTLLFPFFAVISMQIARIERRMPVLAAIQFGGAILLLVFFAVCSMLWIAATFRPELDASTVRALHDLAWLIFVMVFPAYTLQMICQAVAGFMDRSPNPTWPRWAAYFNLWVGFAGMGGGLAVFFKDGPFAWNGLIGFYVPLTVFAIWVLVTTFVLTKAIKRQDAEGRMLADPTAVDPVERRLVTSDA